MMSVVMVCGCKLSSLWAQERQGTSVRVQIEFVTTAALLAAPAHAMNVSVRLTSFGCGTKRM
jgi:hypothetical protein